MSKTQKQTHRSEAEKKAQIKNEKPEKFPF